MTATDKQTEPNFVHVEDQKPEEPASSIGSSHRQYLLRIHGTCDLDPIPSESDDDPLNWPRWKKNTQMLLMVVHTFMMTFSAAAVISGFNELANAYGVTIQMASYLCSIQLLFIGIFPVFWNPVSERYGRRPVFILSTFAMCVCNIAGGFCRSYGSQFVTRALVAIFGCPPVGFGSAVVTELFFAHERAQKIGWWTLLLILGVPLGPLVMGFVVQRVGIDWIFWILACANGAQLVAYLSFKDETLYDRNAKWTAPQSTRSWVPRLNAAPLTWKDFARPLYFFARFKVLVPAVSYAMVFAYANTAIIVELPSIYVELYGFDTAKVGLQYVSVLIGAGIGEQISGPFSDIFLRWLRTQAGPRYPEQRLWLSYPAFMAVVAGIIVWGVQLDKAQEAQEPHWDITPLVGASIASFGGQIIATTLITYSVDCYQEASSDIGVFINVVRQVWAFIGPFYFPAIYQQLGFGGGSGLLVGILGVASIAPIAVIHFYGEHGHEKREIS